MIRVLIVDDQRLIRDSLRMLFDGADDFTVVGEARDGQTAADEFARTRPDLVTMDLRMPGVDGITAIKHIRAQDPDAVVVVLTTFDDDEHLYPALQAGAAGFLAKDIAPDELLDALRRSPGRRALVSGYGPAADRAGVVGAGEPVDSRPTRRLRPDHPGGRGPRVHRPRPVQR